MSEQFITIERQARFHTLGNKEAKKIVVALHGYGQLAKYFIQKFDILKEEWFVVAPEAPHRFYTNGNSGRVGASWMTKDIREKDIADNQLYLDELLKHLHQDQSYEEVVLVGFSQGGATAARYFYSEQQWVQRLVIWASDFPADIIQTNDFSALNLQHQNTFVLGTQDEYFSTEEQQLTILQTFQEIGFAPIRFEGTHNIDSNVLKQLFID